MNSYPEYKMITIKHGNMCFIVTKLCRCSRQCGGIFCDPIAIKSLRGTSDVYREIIIGL